MRIAIFTDNFFPELSGVADSVVSIVKELGKRGHVLNIFVPKYSKANYDFVHVSKREIDLGPNVSVTRIPSLSFPTPSKQGRMIIPGFCFLKLRKFKPDLILTQDFFGLGVEALIGAKLLRKPLMGTNHTQIEAFTLHGLGKLFQPILKKYVIWYYNQCDFVTTPSQFLLETMKERGLKVPSIPISNALEEEYFIEKFEKEELKEKYGLYPFTVLYAGRISEEKNIETLVRGFIPFSQKNPNAGLVLVGHGDKFEQVKKIVDENGISEKVKFMGPFLGEDKKKLFEIFKAADVFVHPGPWETLSMVTLQAMASGLPVIGANSGALPGLIGSERGLLFDHKNHEEIHDHLHTICNDPKLCKEMGKKAKEFASRFSSSKITDHWENSFGEIFKKKYSSKPMKLTFSIPAYNEENNIGQCLESIIRHSKGKNYDIEIVVVDNASTDKTSEIASSYSGVRVVHESQKGLLNARQTGFRNSTGDLVANVDADTVLTPGWLENVLNHFQNDEELVALSGPHIYADLPLAKRFFAKVFYAGGYITYLINRFVLKVGSMLQGGNFVVRRSALEKINGFNTNFNFYGEDTEIACRLHRVGKVKFTFSLPIIASSRRIKAEGFLSMGFKYGINYFWTIIFRKPFTKTFIDVRIPKKK